MRSVALVKAKAYLLPELRQEEDSLLHEEPIFGLKVLQGRQVLDALLGAALGGRHVPQERMRRQREPRPGPGTWPATLGAAFCSHRGSRGRSCSMQVALLSTAERAAAASH